MATIGGGGLVTDEVENEIRRGGLRRGLKVAEIVAGGLVAGVENEMQASIFIWNYLNQIVNISYLLKTQ